MTASTVPARLITAVVAVGIVVWSAAASRDGQAAGADQDPVNQNPRRFEIRGMVVDGKSGEPVEGVTVRLLRLEAGPPLAIAPVVTDQRGAFTLRVASLGHYSLSAFRSPASFGEFDRDPFSQGPTRWFPVPASGPIVIRLWEFPKIAGTVTDETGQPLRGVVVRAMYKGVLGGRPVLKSVPHTARTDDRGRYVLGRLAPRSYVVVATPPVTSTALALRPLYYPAASQASLATPVRVSSPSQTVEGIDFQLRRERGYRVSGLLERPAPIADPVRVELYDAPWGGLPMDSPVGAATISEEGRFEIHGVAPGSYELRFVRFPRWQPKGSPDVRPGFMEGSALPTWRLAPVPEEPTWWTAERLDVVDRDVSLSVRLSEGARLSGRVLFEGPETPSPDILQRHGIYVRSADHRFSGPTQLGSGAAQLGAARADGSFTTTGLPFGRYVVGMLYPYPGFQVESVRIGGREVAGVSFEVSGDIADVVVVLAARTTAIMGRIEGALNDDRFVLVWPEDSALWTGAGTRLGRIYRAVTSDGFYRLQVYPGAYRVVAMTGLPPEDWESPEYLTSLMRVSQPVSVPAGQTVTHNPPLASRR